MPAVHHERFRVRYHECDANGRLSRDNYLRWMAEAAFAASAAVGYDFARYDRIGHLWLIRDSEIEYLAPLEYEDEVEIKTWVLDFRRFHSRRSYEFTKLHSGELAARASTDWVYLDARTLQPATIPEEMQRAFIPEGAPAEAPGRERFPAPPPPPAQIFTCQRQVEWRDIDRMWHVNNSVYLTYIEEAGRRLCEARGWPLERIHDEGFDLLVRQQRIEYRQPARLGEALEILTWLSDPQPASVLVHTAIQRAGDGALLVRARSRWGGVDPQGREPTRIPTEFLKDLAADRSPG